MCVCVCVAVSEICDKHFKFTHRNGLVNLNPTHPTVFKSLNSIQFNSIKWRKKILFDAHTINDHNKVRFDPTRQNNAKRNRERENTLNCPELFNKLSNCYHFKYNQQSENKGKQSFSFGNYYRSKSELVTFSLCAFDHSFFSLHFEFNQRILI